jgi:hypothetical protein
MRNLTVVPPPHSEVAVAHSVPASWVRRATWGAPPPRAEERSPARKLTCRGSRSHFGFATTRRPHLPTMGCSPGSRPVGDRQATRAILSCIEAALSQHLRPASWPRRVKEEHQSRHAPHPIVAGVRDSHAGHPGRAAFERGVSLVEPEAFPRSWMYRCRSTE